MAKGFPDWFRPWSQFAGSVKRGQGSATIDRDQTDTLLSLTAKGQVLGGYGHSVGVATNLNDYFTISIDGSVIQNCPFTDQFSWGMTRVHTAPLYVIEYDSVNKRMTVGFSPYLAFLETFLVEYTATSDIGTRNVSVELYYSVME